MVKKIIVIILCFSLITPAFNINVEAAEYEFNFLTIKRLNDGDVSTYKVLTDGKDLYISTSDLIKLAKFDSKTIDMSEDELNQVILTKKKDHHGFNQDIIIDNKKNVISSDIYGQREFDGCIMQENDVYLDFVKIINYLRIKADVVGKELLINIPVYTMLDFMIEDYQAVLINAVSQLDLLKAQESSFTSGFIDALSLACNNFDFRLLIPGWGSNALKDEQYTKAIQALNEDDEVFYNEDTKSYMNAALKEKGFTRVLATGEDLVNVMSFGGSTVETAEDVLDTLEGVSDDAINSFMDLVNWNGQTFDGTMQLRAWNKQAGKLSDALSLANIIVTAYETYEQAEKWNEDGIKDLEVLKELDTNNYGDHKEYVDRIKKIAEKCVQDHNNSVGAVSEKAFSDVAALILEKTVAETSIYGQVADLFVLAINTGVSVAKCFGNVAEAMDKSELSYMVSCLINVAVAARIDAEIKYDAFDLNDINSNDIKEFRNSMRTALKSNLRCWSYIFYLNSDGEWEDSYRGKEVKKRIDETNALLTLLDETEQYDYALDEYDLYVYSPEKIINILLDDADIVFQAYKQLVQKYENQFGTLYTDYDYLLGVCFLDLIDFDQDGTQELVMVYGQKNDWYNYTCEVWGYENGKAFMLNQMGVQYWSEFASVIINNLNNNMYISEGWGDEIGGDIKYYGFTTNGFEITKHIQWEYDDLNGTPSECFIDGELVTSEEWKRQYDLWGENEQIYSLNADNVLTIETTKATRKQLGLSSENAFQTSDDCALSEDEIYQKLVEHYSNGTEDGARLTVWEGTTEGNYYETQVRTGVPGNPEASQMIYQIKVDIYTGEVTQIYSLGGYGMETGEVEKFILNNEE